ncbi:hypothetical protein [Kutzneria chonburiensis]|uniref:Uncharacterized protein n=1 Tax=Kutzneria chonburiensis TaxID=1483604 RepID=A0ABV6N5U2_9PSEU|nr:hypothetical protein [Kutzneria chonburiensis]
MNGNEPTKSVQQQEQENKRQEQQDADHNKKFEQYKGDGSQAKPLDMRSDGNKHDDPPKVPGTDPAHPGKGDTAVNTAAMARFAWNMGILANTVSAVNKSLVPAVYVKPGAFLTAKAKVQKPVGTVGDNLVTATEKIHTMLLDVIDDVGKTLLAYEKADELNKMTADKYNELFNQSGGDLDNVKWGGSGS